MGTIQIRNVPDDIRETLKARAALLGTSLSEYLRSELKRLAERPTREVLIARLPWGVRDAVSPTPADILRKERDGR